MDFNIIFCAINTEHITSYDKHLKQFENTTFYIGNFINLDGKFDCIVSPGNSFGLMDGGMDAAINRYFSEIDEFIVHIQQQLLDKCGGYQQPGSCVLFETNIKKCPYIAHTPTMGIPLAITDFSIIYHAMWNILIEVHKHNKLNPDKKIKTILCPGLGTGAGKVKSDIAFQLMQYAIQDYIDFLSTLDKPQTHPRYLITWDAATIRYKKLFKLLESIDKTIEYDMYDLMNLRKLQM